MNALKTDEFIVFNKPDLGEEEMSAMMDVMRSGWIGTGRIAFQFEEEFAQMVGGKYAVAVSSCTIGLELVLKALGIGGGDEVILPTLTFAATLNAVLAVGAKPILCDVGKNGCLDLDNVNFLVNERTKAIIPVHFSGTPVQLKSPYKDLHIIEDCAHAFGNKLEGDNPKVFSFYANKNITCGEGGMIVVNTKKLADDIRVLSLQGLSRGAWRRYGPGSVQSYSVEKVGLKGNLPDLLACVGLVQLRRWPEMKEKRLKVWKIYEEAFGPQAYGHSTHFYPFRTKNRDIIREQLYEKGIGTGIHYKPLHLEPAYIFLGYSKGDFPIAERWGETELSLPVSSTMTEEDALRIIQAIKEIKHA